MFLINWISWKFKTSAHQKTTYRLGEIFPIHISDTLSQNILKLLQFNYKKENEPINKISIRLE